MKSHMRSWLHYKQNPPIDQVAASSLSEGEVASSLDLPEDVASVKNGMTANNRGLKNVTVLSISFFFIFFSFGVLQVSSILICMMLMLEGR